MQPEDCLDVLLSKSSERAEIFSGLFERYQEPLNEKELIETIENHLQCNLIEYYRNRIIAIFLNDATIYNTNEHRKCIEQLKKLRKIFTFNEIKIYLLVKMNPEQDSKIWFLIENVLDSQLKDFIINRENERNKLKLPYWNKKIQHEWNQLTAIVPTEDLLTYSLTVLKNERKKRCL